ncbi:MAG: hypothetical protein ABWY06_18255 [Pseudomonas sp.]|uniref:hypothetical protein n=1 Tax=Pseudomonas sp. TaxID=306 RepID=UPI00339652A5
MKRRLVIGFAFCVIAGPPTAAETRLKQVTLHPVPQEMCGFSFNDTGKWRIEESAFDGNCNSQRVLRYSDGPLPQWAVSVEAWNDETLTSHPARRVLLAFQPGQIDRDQHDLSFLMGLNDLYGLTLTRDGKTWSNGGTEKLAISDLHGYRALTGEGDFGLSFDSGHYCCTVGVPFTIVDGGHGTLMSLTGDEEDRNASEPPPFIESLAPLRAR